MDARIEVFWHGTTAARAQHIDAARLRQMRLLTPRPVSAGDAPDLRGQTQ